MWKRRLLMVLVVMGWALVPRFANVWGTFRDGTVVFGSEDPYYHMRRIEMALETGGILWPVDTYVNFPEGALIDLPPGFDLLMAAITAVVQLVFPGLSAAAICAVAVPVLGALTAGSTALLVAWRERREHAGWCAGLIVACLAAHIDYTQIGRVDHHVCEPLLLEAPLAFLVAFRSPVPQRRMLAWCGGAAATALGPAVWPGAVITLCPFVAALWMSVGFWKQTSWKIALAALLTGLFTSTALTLSSPWGAQGDVVYFALSWFQPLLWLGAIAFILAWALVAEHPRFRLLGVIAAALAILAVAWFGQDTLLRAGRYIGTTEAQISSVYESQPLAHRGLVFATAWLSPLLFAVPLALVAVARRCLRERDPYLCYLVVGSAFGGILALSQVRFGCLFTVPLAILIATSLSNLSWGWAALASALALTSTRPFLSLEPFGLAQPYEARDVFLWLKDEAPPTSGFNWPEPRPEYAVLASWGWGHWINYLAQKPNIASPLGQTDTNLRGVHRAARILLSPDVTVALADAETLGVRYVLVSAPEPDIAGLARAVDLDPTLFVDWTSDPADLRPAYLSSFMYELYGHDGLERGVEDRVRLVYESNVRRPFLGEDQAWVKLFEIVQGADLEVTTEPGQACVLSQSIYARSDRTLLRETTQIADSNGHVAFRVPYATKAASPSTIGASEVSVTCGGATAMVPVGESAVIEGSSFAVSARAAGPDGAIAP